MTDPTGRLDDVDWLAEQAASRSASAIARDLGVATGTVLRRLKLAGIPTRQPTRTRRRPAELDDQRWLADRYGQVSAETIAAELGVAPSTVRGALADARIAPRTRHESAVLQSVPELHDVAWLTERYEAGATGADIAAELDVSVPAAYKALERHLGELDGAWVRRDTTRLTPPPEVELRQMYETDPSIKNVALRLGVSATTATVWLADIGIFASDTPALSRQDLERAIAKGWSIAAIATHHRVGPRTVAVELRRHGLRDAHRLRPHHTNTRTSS